MEIYKYLHPKRKDFFNNYRLRFTQPMSLNDPYECLPAISETDYKKLIESVIKSRENTDIVSRVAKNRKARRILSKEFRKAKTKLQKEYEKSDKVEKLFIESYKKAVNNLVGILCLSKRNDSCLMWSHYTDGHKGFVVGFNSDHEFFKRQKTDPKDIGTLEEVRYSLDRFEVDIIDIKLTSDLFLIKNEEWKYEEEMRLVRYLSKASHIIENQEPYIYLFDIPKDCISSIIFGINCTEEIQKEIRSIVNSDDLLRNVPFYQAHMDYKSFIIQTRPIS